MRFHADSVNVAHLKRHVLSNVGLLTVRGLRTASSGAPAIATLYLHL
jgi:hypothetical protein